MKRTRSRMSLVGETIIFELHLLKKMTNNFSDTHKVGSGGFGNVYEAVYNGEKIAVKKLHQLHGIDGNAFDNEFRNLTRVSHQNVVRLIGYCSESHDTYIEHNGQLVRAAQMEKLLCFEFMEGGSLANHISSDETCDLDWPTCYKIIKGTCEGLNHLHYTAQQGRPILHLDLKPANVLLDKDMTAKISDLGLSRLVSSTQTYKTQNLKGTMGYMPPEFIESGSMSKKSDVFSLGVIIIKMMAGEESYASCYGMPQEQFVELVSGKWKKRLQSISRHSLQEIDIRQVETCVKIALKCVDANREKRPQIKDIVKELETLEAEIKRLSLSSDQSKRISDCKHVLGIDPTLEVRFPFELRKDIPSCVQLTNKTNGFIAYNIQVNQTKYDTAPNKGIIAPCSKCYIWVTLRAQEEAPINMQCNDIFLVQVFNVRHGGLTSEDDITEKFSFQEVDMVDEVQLPIVYVPNPKANGRS